MYRSNVLIIVDPKHPDRNSLQDIMDALIDLGAEVIDVNQHQHIIEAVISADEVSTVQAMGGVAYVRPIFTYLAAGQAVVG